MHVREASHIPDTIVRHTFFLMIRVVATAPLSTRCRSRDFSSEEMTTQSSRVTRCHWEPLVKAFLASVGMFSRHYQRHVT